MKTTVVNDDSIEMVALDAEKRESVSQRVLYNDEIIEARGNHASRSATKKLSSVSESLQNAIDVAQGYQQEVMRINSNMNILLQALKEEDDRMRRQAELE